MAGVGHKPVPLPDTVKVSYDQGTLTVEGPKGVLQVPVDAALSVEVTPSGVLLTRADDSRRAKARQGLIRTLVANAVQGVSTGFSKVLEINGVGYRADAVKDIIQLSLGFSHPIFFQLPVGVSAKVERQTQITIEGVDKQLVGEVAASIRRLRPPEPYKGKGIKYGDEHVRRKAGKTAVAAGG
jgi:large subunit ribosomal protein L6